MWCLTICLSPSQQREWERLIDECVIDREEVILDIFARRARTREATLQVELARMQYSLPRMARMWNHLDRQGGGSGGGKGGGGAARGEGEKQIEVDRRLARARIEAIQKELALVTRQRATQRKERERQAVASGRPSWAIPMPGNPPCFPWYPVPKSWRRTCFLPRWTPRRGK